MNPGTNDLTLALRNQWIAGAAADALALAGQHPEVADDPSALAALAYEEFCLRRSAGEQIDHEAFCGRFAGCRSALRQMLAFDDVLGHNPALLDGAGPTRQDYPRAGEEVCGCLLVRELGRGAFSTVYLAREPEAGGRAVVLKLSRLATGEGGVLGPLGHEHVVPMHWSRHDKGTGWNAVCMPFLGAATLTHVIDRLYPAAGAAPPASGQAVLAAIAAAARPGDPPPARPPAGGSLEGLTLPQAAARLGGRLASALAYLHGRGLAHGDVKPSNVLLQAGGQPLLLDFNLSRAAEMGRVGGTFSYMSPEHLRAFEAGKAPTQQEASSSDVYSLGVMLYELLTGELPHGGPTGEGARQCAGAMLERRRTPPWPVRRRNPSVPAKLAKLIERCLSPELAARPAAAEAAAALAERKPRRLFLAAALLSAVLLGVGGGTFAFWASSPSESQSRERGRERLEEGRRLLAAGRTEDAHRALHEADEAFDHAIESHKKAGARLGAWGDYFDRGKVQLSLEDARQARAYFSQAQEAYRLEKGPGKAHGPTMAYLSYSAALSADHSEAVAAGKVALPLNRRSSAVRNNLAYVLMRRGKQDEPEARRLLDEAIALDRGCLPAYHNRARLVYQHALREMLAPAPPQRPLDLTPALRDVEAAIGLSLEGGRGGSAELYRLAALLYGRAAQTEKDGARRQDLRRHANGYAVRACQLGLDRGALETNLMLAGVLEGGRLAGVDRARTGEPRLATWTYLIEPEGSR